MSVNKVFLIGNLGRDPERHNNGSMAVCRFSIAVGNGDHPDWVDIVTFEKTAELCQRYLKKGRKVHVEGRLKMNKWEDKDGNKRKSIDIVGDRVTFLGGREEEVQPQTSFAPPARLQDDDIPF